MCFNQKLNSGCLTTKGESCRFPFTYRGVEYTECTPVANNGVPWCYTNAGYGNCVGSCTPEATTTTTTTMTPSGTLIQTRAK